MTTFYLYLDGVYHHGLTYEEALQLAGSQHADEYEVWREGDVEDTLVYSHSVTQKHTL